MLGPTHLQSAAPKPKTDPMSLEPSISPTAIYRIMYYVWMKDKPNPKAILLEPTVFRPIFNLWPSRENNSGWFWDLPRSTVELLRHRGRRRQLVDTRWRWAACSRGRTSNSAIFPGFELIGHDLPVVCSCWFHRSRWRRQRQLVIGLVRSYGGVVALVGSDATWSSD